MKYIILFFAFTTLLKSNLFGQKTSEREAIKSMCGCFEVTFEYAETFTRDSSYHTRSQPYTAHALEYVTVAEETSDIMVLQHLLVINDSLVIKHWRQDWHYQPRTLFSYTGRQQWRISPVAPRTVRGQWAQKVYEVDDSPRYSGTATWFFADGRKFWENTADAPLPRREYTKRSDYHIMRRTNRHEIVNNGWLHDQENEKIVVNGPSKLVLVEEKGRNTYKQTDPARCKVASDYWKKNESFWRNVRIAWADVLSNTASYSLSPQVNGKYLGQSLDALSQTVFTDDQAAQAAIKTLLEQYITKITIP